MLCSAMKPLLPFLEDVERFSSFDRVTAVYVNRHGVISISETSLQTALHYVTNIALMEHCEDAKQFKQYFRGVEPFMSIDDAVAKIFLNIFWLHDGDKVKVTAAIEDLRTHLTTTAGSCIKRLRVMCKSDAFVNAYIKTQVYGALLAVNPRDAVNKYFVGENR